METTTNNAKETTMKAKNQTWFVYVESKECRGKFIYFGEYNGFSNANAEQDAQDTAAELAMRGSRAFLANQYMGSGFVPSFFDVVSV